MLRTAQSLPLGRAFDAALRRQAFPPDAGSLLPGLLAATRTGLPPASDDEHEQQIDLYDTRSPPVPLGARKREVSARPARVGPLGHDFRGAHVRASEPTSAPSWIGPIENRTDHAAASRRSARPACSAVLRVDTRTGVRVLIAARRRAPAHHRWSAAGGALMG